MYPMKELTKAEEEIMQILWKIEKGFVKDIIEQMPEPRPAYNTVSTIVRILGALSKNWCLFLPKTITWM